MQTKLGGELRADAGELSPAQQGQQVAAIDDAVLLLTGELLLDQPLSALGECVADLAPKACVSRRRLGIGHQLAIKPSGALGAEDLALERQGRERLDDDGLIRGCIRS